MTENSTEEKESRNNDTEYLLNGLRNIEDFKGPLQDKAGRIFRFEDWMNSLDTRKGAEDIAKLIESMISRGLSADQIKRDGLINSAADRIIQFPRNVGKREFHHVVLGLIDSKFISVDKAEAGSSPSEAELKEKQRDIIRNKIKALQLEIDSLSEELRKID